MASAGPHPGRPEGRIIPFFHPDVHVEARRLGAAAFDLLVVLVAQTWINDVFGVTHVTGGAPFTPVGDGYAYVTSATTVDAPWLALLVVVLFTVQEALFGTTWGKLLAGLRVVDVEGERPSLGAVIVRNILRLVDFWPGFYLVGIVAAGLSPRRQRLGDRVAHTLVVRAETAPLTRRTPQEIRHGMLGLLAAIALFAAFCFGFSYYGRPPLVIRGLANIGALPGPAYHRVVSYTLGTPSWGSGAVTYPIRYTIVADGKRCAGRITIRWHGFFGHGGGWVPDGGAVTCR